MTPTVRFLRTSIACLMVIGAAQCHSNAALAQGRGSPTIWLMDANGGNARQFIKMPDYHWRGSAVWSQDGKWIAFDAAKTPGGGAHVFKIGASGRDMTLRDLGPGRVPSWSNDGETIAFYSYGEARDGIKAGVWTMKSNGEKRTWRCDGQRPKWSPDGTKIALASDHEGQRSVYVYQQGESKRVLHDEFDSIAGPNWSPDGKELAFIGGRNGRKELVFISAKGSEHSMRVRYAGEIGWIPSWSADGKSVLIWVRQQDGATWLHTINPMTDDPPRLLKGQEGTHFNSDASWSPDGKTIAFSSDREE